MGLYNAQRVYPGVHKHHNTFTYHTGQCTAHNWQTDTGSTHDTQTSKQLLFVYLDQPSRCVRGHDMDDRAPLPKQIPAGKNAERLSQALLLHFAHATDLCENKSVRCASSQPDRYTRVRKKK